VTKFEPSFAIVPLQQVSPGAAVIFQHALAFVGTNPSVQPLAMSLAVYDPQQGKFVYRYFNAGQPNVLVPTGQIIIRPALHTLTENVSLRPASNQLFHEKDTHIVAEIPGTTDIVILSLTNGSLLRPTASNMDAFTSWEVGIESLGDFVTLLKV
jgi:hypothetical protein